MRLVLLTCFLLFTKVSTASCFELAGEEFQIDWRVIYAIASVESNLNADAINVNKNRSIDVGMMQINTIHQNELASRGIAMNELLDPCKNIIVGTWILKKNIAIADGDIWKGVGYYHSSTPKFQISYINKVKDAYYHLIAE
ncbi:MAG: lytic transglycosylase domain-containing protein [Kluyvera sp.]|uniref:lytic transglycosylase domain-containing protein n=1 Tax=Kluyvera sp. TaxID=1538228 RepID=UPI003F2D1B74